MTAAEQMVQAQEEMVAKFFGNPETFAEFGHLYVIEYEEIQMFSRDSIEDKFHNQQTIQFRQNVRIRFKTPEELEADEKDPPVRPTRDQIDAAWPKYDH